MNELNLTIISLFRKKIQSISIILVVALVVALIAVFFTAQNALHQYHKEILANTPPLVEIHFPHTPSNYDLNESRNIVLTKILESDFVRENIGFTTGFLMSDDIRQTIAADYEGSGWIHQFALFGVNDEVPLQFEIGAFELYSGRFFLTAEIDSGNIRTNIPVMISRNLAQVNDIAVGDLLNFRNIISVFLSDDEIKQLPANFWNFYFEIIGLFELDYAPFLNFLRDYEGNPDYTPIGNLVFHLIYAAKDTILVPHWFNEQANSEIEDTIRVLERWEELLVTHRLFSATIDQQDTLHLLMLHDSLDLFEFKDFIENIGYDNIIVHSFLAENEMVLSTISQFTAFLDIFLVGVIIAGLLVIMLILCLILRDKKLELGIYMALGGANKIKRIILLEFLILTVSGLAFGLLLSGVFSGRLAAYFTSSFMSAQLTIDNFLETILSPGFMPTWSIIYSRFRIPPNPIFLQDTHSMLDFSLTFNQIFLIIALMVTFVLLFTSITLKLILRKPAKEMLL